ncbi:MAG TPA: DEAD/DEAH box helicase family protein [Kofleriaceae bacterium]|jgi:excisionase family DNA binding protein
MSSIDQSFIDPDFLSVAQAAKYLSVSVPTLRRWDESGKLISVRHPANGYRFYRRADIEKFRLEYQAAEASANEKVIFETAAANIATNMQLREPQRGAHEAARQHFAASNSPVILQLPVGCGKTGVIATLPFGISKGRVLVITPNVTIRKLVAAALDISNPKCFWRARGVLKAFVGGPFTAILDGTDANIHDCLKSHFVVTNIQQLASSADRWLPKFPTNFFDMILVDEGHHNAAPSWRKVFDRFPEAKVVSLTATPFRGDQKKLAGNVIYRYPFTSAMTNGFIKKITSTNVVPSEIYFTYRGEDRRHTLDEVLALREEAWFSRGVALSEECNVHIVDESIARLKVLRVSEKVRHQIIAVACSVDHARQVRALYEQRGLRAQEIHSAMDEDERESILERLRRGGLDCIVQVQMLGEGFDHPPLSVAAIFRPFRSLAPYIQFVGRIMRVNVEGDPEAADNHGFVVSHVGMNNDARWDDFRELDLADQQMFHFWLTQQGAKLESPDGTGDGRPRRFDQGMIVSQEILNAFVTNDPFLDVDDDRVLDQILDRQIFAGVRLGDVVGDREAFRERLRAAQPSKETPVAPATPVSPQRARQTGRVRLNERTKSVANRVLADLKLGHRGYDLMNVEKGGRQHNLQVAIGLLGREVNTELGQPSGTRGEWSLDQVERGLANLDALGDRVRDRLRAKIAKE